MCVFNSRILQEVLNFLVNGCQPSFTLFLERMPPPSVSQEYSWLWWLHWTSCQLHSFSTWTFLDQGFVHDEQLPCDVRCLGNLKDMSHLVCLSVLEISWKYASCWRQRCAWTWHLVPLRREFLARCDLHDRPTWTSQTRLVLFATASLSLIHWDRCLDWDDISLDRDALVPDLWPRHHLA